MAFDLKFRVECFLREWDMRSIFLEGEKFSTYVVEEHRKDILHMYQITEQNVEQYENEIRQSWKES